jgi:hypothetical protein
MKLFAPPLLALSLSAIATSLMAADAPKPLKVLLITGGCCHDYATQKDLLKAGLESRALIAVDQIHVDVTKENATKPPLPIYGNPTYAKGYDVVIHDECAAGVSDQPVIEGVLAPHLDGVPAVNLHCAMHCYRIGNASEPASTGTPHGLWFEYLGLQSSGHGPQEPISVAYTPSHPITKGLENWTTIKEELYNNIQVFPSATPLAKGTQTAKQKDGSEKTSEVVVAWSNLYGPKRTRIFSTTIGHNNDTVNDSRYLDLVTRGVLWSAGKLTDEGKPAPGYSK